MEAGAQTADWRYRLFRCVAVETVIAYLIDLLAAFLTSNRGVHHYTGAISGCSMLLLLLCSVAYSFVNREKALWGFVVVAIGLVTVMLFPEL